MSERLNQNHNECFVTERERLALEVLGKAMELLEMDGFEWRASGQAENLHAEYRVETPELFAGKEPRPFNRLVVGGVPRLILNHSFPYVEQTQEGFLFKTRKEIEHSGVTKVILRVPRSSDAYGKENFSLVFKGASRPTFYYSNEIRSSYSEYRLPCSYPIKTDQREVTEEDLKDFLGLLNSQMYFIEPADYLSY